MKTGNVKSWVKWTTAWNMQKMMIFVYTVTLDTISTETGAAVLIAFLEEWWIVVYMILKGFVLAVTLDILLKPMMNVRRRRCWTTVLIWRRRFAPIVIEVMWKSRENVKNSKLRIARFSKAGNNARLVFEELGSMKMKNSVTWWLIRVKNVLAMTQWLLINVKNVTKNSCRPMMLNVLMLKRFLIEL